MASTTARTKEDVQAMSKADRLWDSMNYTYGVQREDLAKQYQQAYSQADRQMLSRGMQRSSYGAQTLANLQQKGLEAQQNSYNTQIADYENRLQEVEQQEWQNAFQEKQFDEGVRQYNQNFTYQQGRDDIADRQWQMAFDQGNKDNDRSLAASYVNALIKNGQMPTDDLLNRAGLSREDAQRMLAQAAAASGGSSSGGKGGTGDDKNNNIGLLSNNAYDDMIFAVANGATNNTLQTPVAAGPNAKASTGNAALIAAGKTPTTSAISPTKPGSSALQANGLKRTERDR